VNHVQIEDENLEIHFPNLKVLHLEILEPNHLDDDDALEGEHYQVHVQVL